MSLSTIQKENIASLAAKINLEPTYVKDYLVSHTADSYTQVSIDLINIRANQLGMSYGQFVGAYNV